MKIGTRLASQNGSTEVLVVRAEGIDDAILCAGQEMVVGAAGPDNDAEPTLLIGKRFEHQSENTRIEVMVTRAGIGPLTYRGSELTASTPRALPTSD